MDKFKIKIFEWKELQDVVINILALIGLIFMFSSIFSCDDDIFIGGYNKDMEEIHYQMFEVDSLIKTIQLDLDSLAIGLKK